MKENQNHSPTNFAGDVNILAIQSGKWALISRVSQVLGGAIVLIALPFWLSPEDFGIITMLTSVLALLMILQQAGLMEVTVQSENNAEEVRSSAFWLSGAIGIFLYILVYIFSPMISKFFNSEYLVLPLRIAGIQLIFQGFSNIALAWMQRQFKFRPYAWIQLVSSLVMVFSAIILATIGKGFWSYVVALLAGSSVRLVMTLWYMDWRPQKGIGYKRWGQILRFGGFVLGEMFLGWLLVWFDNVVVAKNLGSRAAGIYSLAFNIAMMSISLPMNIITGVTLSMFSRLQNNMDTLRKTYLEFTSIIACYALPAGIGLSIMGASLMKLIYPGKWVELGTILPILALYAGFGHLWILNTDVFKAIGKPEIMLKIYLPTVAIMMPIYWWASQIGLMEFSIARSMVVLVGAIPHTYFAVRYLRLEKTYLIKLISGPLMASIMMAVIVWHGVRVSDLLPSHKYQLAVLMCIIGIGITSYWMLLRWLSPKLTRRISSLFIKSIQFKSING